MATSNQRKIVVYIATSADGYIARHDGNVDWLHRPGQQKDYGMAEFYKSIDTIIWGRRTFDEAVVRMGGKPEVMVDPKGKIKNYVISHRPGVNVAGLEFVKDDVKGFAKRLRAEPGKNIWMMGGGEVIASFLDEGEIDEFMIHVIPTLIGEGIPLIAPRNRDVELKLINTKSWDDGVILLHYKVLAGRPTRPKQAKTSRTKRKTGKSR